MKIGARIGCPQGGEAGHCRFGGVGFGHQGRACNPKGQRTRCRSAPIGRHLGLSDTGVQNPGYAVSICMCLPRKEARHPVILGQFGQTGSNDGNDLFMQHARGATFGIAKDMTVRRVVHILHARHLDRAAVQTGVVEGTVIDQHRPIGDCAIKQFGRQITIAKDSRLPPRAKHDRQVGFGRCMGAQGGDQLILAGDIIEIGRRGDVDPAR